MAINKNTLTKGQKRKLNALRRSVGNDLGEEVFGKWMIRQAAAVARKADPVCVRTTSLTARSYVWESC